MGEFASRVSQVTRNGGFAALGIETIQVNVGLVCNQECVHCHVAASPRREEVMQWETMELVLAAAARARCALVDITGGAPELNPHFRRFIAALTRQGQSVQVRTNLTVLLEPGMEEMPRFMRDHGIKLIASLPCYLEGNVNAQRGPGVYERSIQAIRRLNQVGYGRTAQTPLSLVYNPGGPFLPPEQSRLEADYRRELEARWGIRFSALLTITNMPIGRFRNQLRRDNQEEGYIQLLKDAFNPQTLDRLMCRHQISVKWDGSIYDCDFNLALGWRVAGEAPRHIRDFEPASLRRRKIVTGDHCFGCTAGAGSSCGGALV